MMRGNSALALDMVTTMAPTTGQTVAFPDAAQNRVMYLNTAGLLATLTVTLPSDAASTIGQVCRITSNNAVTALTIAGATTILGAPAGLTLGNSISFQKVAANTWHRLT